MIEMLSRKNESLAIDRYVAYQSEEASRIVPDSIYHRIPRYINHESTIKYL